MKLLRFFCIVVGLSISLWASAKNPIKVVCPTSGTCNIIETKTGKVLINTLPNKPTINARGENIFEINTSCGSPCSHSAYYDAKSKQISKLFPDVVAVSPIYKKVLYTTKGKILCSSMFGPNQVPYPLKMKNPLARTAVTFSAIISAEFLSPTQVKIAYLTGDNRDETSEIIDLATDKK
ncbi:MAG: hypothetical protein HY080_13015 [Gammaproteobacteria bacterium]|nr:hypothetical protein [Gammaproteobacteria bacterium]